MRQILLATALIALPVAAFTGFQFYEGRANASAHASSGLGDLSTFSGIVTDVQAIAAKRDFATAKVRIKDFEIAWDHAEAGLKPSDPDHWTKIDQAADAAFTALRAKTPDAAAINETLIALQSTLAEPAPAKK